MDRGLLEATITVGGSGATSIQLAPSAIIKGTISGYKFEDVNGNGVWDSGGGELGLSGWTNFIDKDGDNSLDSGEESTTTAAIDPYVIREVNQNGWVRTTVNPIAIAISAADPTEMNVNLANQKTINSLTIAKTAVVPGNTANVAGEVISYTVTNTGNIDLTSVVMADAYTDSASVLASGDTDTDTDSVLDVGEVWVYKAAHTVTQAELNSNGGGDGKLENTADVVTLQTAKQSATADVLIDASGLLTIDKITIIGSQTGDGLTNVAVGTPVTWKYTVANTGNVSLNSVTVKDDAGIISNLTDDFTAT